MDLFLIIAAFLLLLAGLAGSVLPVLPGPPLSFIGVLLAGWSGYAQIGGRMVWIMAALAVIVTVADYYLPAMFARRLGGSRYAQWGAFIGMLAGIIFFPPIGMLVGSFAGALLGQLIDAPGDFSHALRVATGSFLAFIVGTGAKLLTSGFMLVYVVAKVLFN